MTDAGSPPGRGRWWRSERLGPGLAPAVAAAARRGRHQGPQQARLHRRAVVVAPVIDVLESFGMSGRLARGRNYARRGQVLGFEISCGYVTAQVQGSRPKPYRVRIQVTPLTTPQWRKVARALAGQALFRAKLLAGDMPRD